MSNSYVFLEVALPDLDDFKSDIYDNSLPHVFTFAGALLTVLGSVLVIRAFASRI